MRKKVNFKKTPKVDRKIRVSFTRDGKKVTFTKTQKVRKPINFRKIWRTREKTEIHKKENQKDG